MSLRGRRCPTGAVTSPRPRHHKQHVAKTNGCSSGGDAAAPGLHRGSTAAPGTRTQHRGLGHTRGSGWALQGGGRHRNTIPRVPAERQRHQSTGDAGASGNKFCAPQRLGGPRAVSGTPQAPSMPGTQWLVAQHGGRGRRPPWRHHCSPQGQHPAQPGAHQWGQDTPDPGLTHCQGSHPPSQGTADPYGLLLSQWGVPEHPQSPHHTSPWAPQKLPRAGTGWDPSALLGTPCATSPWQHSRAGKGSDPHATRGAQLGVWRSLWTQIGAPFPHPSGTASGTWQADQCHPNGGSWGAPVSTCAPQPPAVPSPEGTGACQAEPLQQGEGPRASSGTPGPSPAPGAPGAVVAPALWPRRQLAPALFTPAPEPGPCAQSWDSCGDSRDTWHWHQATVRGSTSTTNTGRSSVGHSSVGHSSHRLAQGPPGWNLPSYCTQPHRDGGTVTPDASSAHSSLVLAPGDTAPPHLPSPSAGVTVPHNPAPNMWLPGAPPGGPHGTRKG